MTWAYFLNNCLFFLIMFRFIRQTIYALDLLFIKEQQRVIFISSHFTERNILFIVSSLLVCKMCNSIIKKVQNYLSQKVDLISEKIAIFSVTIHTLCPPSVLAPVVLTSLKCLRKITLFHPILINFLNFLCVFQTSLWEHANQDAVKYEIQCFSRC